jgi:hypothetical protein
MALVDTVMSLGDDAMVNQTELFFPEGIPGGGNADNVALRADQSIDMPEIVYAQYEFFFKGIKIVKTSRLEETDKAITIDVRVDLGWNVWDDLRKWMQLGFNEKDATAAPDLSTRVSVGIRNLDGDNNPAKTFYLRYAKLRGLKATAFDQATGDPVRATLNLIFADIDDGNGV